MRNQFIPYPRKRLARGMMRRLGRMILPLFFRIQIRGKENFPATGPLIVVGNHSAIMEVVMLFVFTPWQVEILGGGDVPHETITDMMARIVGYIPYQRGQMDRPALKRALGVLQQGGVLGIFP
jgi:1-acyl-sn-glycerol-3-phosphate acyltransferase